MRKPISDIIIFVIVPAILIATIVVAVDYSIANQEPMFVQDEVVCDDAMLDTSNAARMHNLGLPTKEDVMQWHIHGQWGYYEYGTQVSYADLPGDPAFWDKLYGIEPNPNFDK